MITGAQIAAARRLLGWEQDKLAKKAKLPVTVVKRAELSLGEPIIKITQLDTLLRTLKAAGIEFMAEEPGVKLARESGRDAGHSQALSSSPRMGEGPTSDLETIQSYEILPL